MLVLSRKAQQIIRIGEAIAIQVIEIRGDTVRLGVDAPRDVRIDREEVRLRIAAGDPPPPRRGGAA